MALDEQALGGEAPELIAAAQGGDELGGGRALERRDRGGLGFIPDDAVNTAAGIIAEGIFVGAADTGLGGVAAALEARGGVVLDNVVLPIGEPHGAVGPDLGEDGGHPFVAAGDEIEGVMRGVAGAVAHDVEKRDVLHRGLADHGLALEAGGELVGVDERAAGGGGVAAHDVHLAEVGRDGVVFVLGVNALGGHGAHAFRDDGGGDAAEENGRVVGGASELVTKLVGALTPRIVGELVEKLEGGAIRLKAIRALGELFSTPPTVPLKPE